MIINEIPSFRVVSHEPGFSFGTCLPAACSVEHFQSIFDELINTKTSDISIKIPESACQTERETNKMETLDVIAM